MELEVDGGFDPEQSGLSSGLVGLWVLQKYRHVLGESRSPTVLSIECCQQTEKHTLLFSIIC